MGFDVITLGRSGQVAQECARLGLGCFGRESADFGTVGAAADLIRKRRPGAVINAAAYTGVDQAEGDEARALRINAQAVGEVAEACAALDIPLVHLSTDYVFDGSGRAPWQPASPVNPLSAYGRSKLAGEIAVRRAGGAHVILRTAWVFSAHGSNFVRTMLRLGAERDALSIVADQIGAPTPARDIAIACKTLAESLVSTPLQATHHFAGTPEVTWAGFARAIFKATGIACSVTDIPSSQYPTPALRPLNSRLDCAQLTAQFGITRPLWQDGLHAVLRELGHDT